MVDGPSIVFKRKAVVDETFIRNLGNVCKSDVDIDASQLHAYSMWQPMPTGLYTRWEYDSESSTFKPQQKKSKILRKWFCHDCKDKDLTVKLRVSTPQELKKRLIVSKQKVFAHIVVVLS